MASSISAVNLEPSELAQTPVHVTAPGAPASQTHQQDTVTLSTVAQVEQLDKAGQSAEQIAQSLGISVDLVDLDLGIVAALPSVQASSGQQAAGASSATPASSSTNTGTSSSTGAKSTSTSSTTASVSATGSTATTASAATPASTATTASEAANAAVAVNAAVAATVQAAPIPATTNAFA